MKIIDSVQIETKYGPYTMSFYDNGFLEIGEFCFSSGFRSLSFNGHHLWDYTKTQATVIDWMLEHSRKFKWIHQYELIRKLEDRTYGDDNGDFSSIKNEGLKTRRLRDFFKLKGGKLHPSFGTFLKTTKGRDSIIYFDFSWRP